jgi:hypothetical protein
MNEHRCDRNEVRGRLAGEARRAQKPIEQGRRRAQDLRYLRGALRVLVWNVESFTDESRPHWRGITEERINKLWELLERNGIDLVVLLETGPDAQTIIDEITQRDQKRQLPSQWRGEHTKVTGRNDPDGKDGPKYAGETYTLLFRGNKLEFRHELIGLELVDGEPCRQACLLYVNDTPLLTFIHAPSTGEKRFTAILDSVLVAKNKYMKSALKGGIFCGDLNIKANEFQELSASMTANGYKFSGPKDPEDNFELPLPTTVRQVNNAIKKGEGSQPYDQVWLYSSGNDLIKVGEVGLHVPSFSLEEGIKLVRPLLEALSAVLSPEDEVQEHEPRAQGELPQQEEVDRCLKKLESAKESLAAVRVVIPKRRDGSGDEELNQLMGGLVEQAAVWLENKETSMREMDNGRLFKRASQEADRIVDEVLLACDAYSALMQKEPNLEGALLRVVMSDHKGLIFSVDWGQG